MLMRASLAILLLFLVACADVSTEETGKKILRYNEIAGIANLDPAYAERFEDIWAMSQLFNGLVRLDSNMNIVPDLAESWHLDSTRLVYTFFLRKDVRFHDNACFEDGKGRQLVAEDVRFSFNRIIDPATASQGKFVFRCLDDSGIQVIDDHTIRIVLDKPQHSFIKMLTLGFCFIVSPEAVSYYGKEFTRNPVGTGPFQFKVWHQLDRLVFEKNNGYFEFDKDSVRLPYIDAVSISFVKSAHAAYQQFLKGQLDFISGLNESYQNALLTYDGTLREAYQGSFYLIKDPWLKTDYLGILVDPAEPVSRNSDLFDKDVRKALNYAIDRKNLVKTMRNGIGIPANHGFVPEGMNAFNGKKVLGYSYNPEKVKHHLFNAGFDGDTRKPKVTLTMQQNYRQLGEFVVRDLNENGFDADLQLMLPALHKQMIADFETNFFRKSWTGDFPDPINFLNLYSSNAFAPDFGPNYTHFGDVEFDLYYALAETTDSDSLRDEMYLKMDQLVTNESVFIPLFYDEIVKFVNKRVTGLRSNPMNQLNLKYVRIK